MSLSRVGNEAEVRVRRVRISFKSFRKKNNLKKKMRSLKTLLTS